MSWRTKSNPIVTDVLYKININDEQITALAYFISPIR